MAVKWAVKNRILLDGIKWWSEGWEESSVIEKDGIKLYWDWERKSQSEKFLHSEETRFDA